MMLNKQRFVAWAVIGALIFGPLSVSFADSSLAPSREIPLKGAEVWTGHTICARQKHKVKLEILNSQGTTANALLEFHMPDRRIGRVRLDGVYSPDSLGIRFKVAQWIEKPHDFNFRPWEGSVTNHRSRFKGTMQDNASSRNARYTCIFDTSLTMIVPEKASLDAARKALEHGDTTAAFAHVQGLSSTGDSEAQYFLGRLFEQGHDGKPQLSLAYHWYKKAADQGHVKAEIRRKALESKVRRGGSIPPALKWTALAMGGAYIAHKMLGGSSDNALSSVLKSALAKKSETGNGAGVAAVAGTAGAVASAKMASKGKAAKGSKNKGFMGWLAVIIAGIGTCIRRVRTSVSQGLRTLMRSVRAKKGVPGKKAAHS